MSTIEATELAFEREIVRDMLGAGGWLGEDPDAGPPTDFHGYDAELGLYPADLVAFVKATQAKAWERLVKLRGGDAAAATALTTRIATEIDSRGTIDVLRRTTTEQGVSFRLAYFAPELKADATVTARYAENRTRVVRQVRFAPGSNSSLDLVLFVNGLPTATVELKSRQRGQSVTHAMRQYQRDRPAGNLLLSRRALVHFALDEHEAWMTTHLAGSATRFLPFNQGSAGPGRPGGRGNPAPDSGGHPSSYLWRSVFDREAWLELLERFVFAEDGRVVFPRFHQWDVVRESSAHARVHGPGQSYLIQHSAGSGKSKEIAWLAHELSTVHGEQGKVFDKVIVITDRRVLDAQLQAQVMAFEQVKGTVQRIDQDSGQLRAALAGEQARVVITTLQKFPFVLRQLEDGAAELKARSYAVIVDEAHSSQTGESAKDLKAVLGGRSIEDLDLDPEQDDGLPEALLATVAARGRQPNLSFFAFTATPKARTLNLFGRPAPGGGFEAFHTYSMQQAIEEGFILDVLANYTTYEQLYRLETKAGEAFEVPEGEGRRQIARFAKWHSHSKAQKASVVVAHFREHVAPRLGGRAKAMVVTSSREEAALYKLAIDECLEREGIDDVGCLVAFSGDVTIANATSTHAGERFTEPEMNGGLPESQLPATFDGDGYGLLVVAEKYQTGFDQPKLCAMYVDKTLTGVNAVQTLSRLNRTTAGKKEVFVLDFVNDEEQIREAFEPYFKATTAEAVDPNSLFDAERRVLDHQVVTEDELAAFAAQCFDPNPDEAKQTSLLSTLTQPAYERALALEETELDELRDAIDAFVRRYSFVSQVLAWLPPATERTFVFFGVLAARLRDDAPIQRLDLSALLDLTHYALRPVATSAIGLTGDGDPLGVGGDGRGGQQVELPPGLLEQLVQLFNERFGAQLSDADATHPIRQIVDRVVATDGVAEQAAANDFDDFALGKDPLFIQALLATQEFNDDFLPSLLKDPAVQKQATTLVLRAAYEQLREAA